MQYLLYKIDNILSVVLLHFHYDSTFRSSLGFSKASTAFNDLLFGISSLPSTSTWESRNDRFKSIHELPPHGYQNRT
ncbi:hypothetical protein [Olivibacter ginsenosidimutans]|uniref:hypothetical protein n=1 Tax=Olivibacter ginsenosidimutans TaxID=1176537 RepID=UPI0031E72BFD